MVFATIHQGFRRSQSLEGLLEGEPLVSGPCDQNVGELAPPEYGCHPFVVPLQQALRFPGVLARWQNQSCNHIGIDDDHGRPSRLAASTSSTRSVRWP